MTVDEINLRGAIVDAGSRRGRVLLFTLLRYTAPPSFIGAPLHRHAVTAEVFCIVEGEATFDRDGEVTVAKRW